jgi:glycosyltransferase involved in cell wall biosynthesis
MLPGKGLNVLADALAKIKEQQWRLLLVGDGSERADFANRLKAAGVLDRAEFTGAISYEQTPAYFQKMDVLVIPTETTDRIREQFGRVIVEAMASGVPVIGSTCGAIPEVIANAGRVFPECDGSALAAALSELLADADLRERFSHEGRKRVEENYSWDSVAEKTFALYQQVLNNKLTSCDSAIELAA